MFIFVSPLKRTHTAIIHSFNTLLLKACCKAGMAGTTTLIFWALPLISQTYPCLKASVFAVFPESCLLKYKHGLLPSSHSNVAISGRPFLTTLFKTSTPPTTNIPYFSSLFDFSPEHLSLTFYILYSILFMIYLIPIGEKNSWG